MERNRLSPRPASSPQTWKKTVAKYQRADLRQSIWQIVNSILPYALLWYLAYRSLGISYWLVLPITVLAAGFMMRIFIIFHDCGHGSFFKSRQANDITGFITGVLTFTSYYQWRHDHAVHHATAGDLDRRGIGDVWTLTVVEYLELPRWKKLAYRLYRNPIVMFVLGPPFVFLIVHRIPDKFGGKRERNGVYWTNLAIAALVGSLIWVMGLKAYLLIQLPILMVGTMVGVWLFYVQHQFETTYWERHEKWDYVSAALHGSSFYKLPKVLQWFSGNIGFHHIHHLSPRIPNYNLEKCHAEEPFFQEVEQITFLSSLKSFTFRLWDEHRRKLVGYDYIKVFRAKQAALSRQ